MDIEPLRFSYETRLLKTIAGRVGGVPLIDHSESKNFLDIRRRDLLSDAVRITEDLLPEVHLLYRSCLDRLGGDIAGDLFVQQSSTYNAGIFGHERRFDLLVHSALLNEFSPDELSFVFGHELGHVLFQHSQFPVQDILRILKDKDPEMSDLLTRWARASEISADRVGMLCCGQLGAASTALFRTVSGLADIDLDRVLRSFRRQFEELAAQIHLSGQKPVWFRTHPMIPIRFKAMELSALDIIALRQSGGFSEKGFRRVDAQIAALMEALDACPTPPDGGPCL